MLKKGLVIALYSPPEYYPPTLNAIELLAGEYEKIHVVFRNYDGGGDWVFPENVHLVPSGKKIGVREAEQVSMLKKIFFFIQYCSKLLRTIRKGQTDTILIYDYIPVLAYRLIRPWIKMPRILWYHNHDVADEKIIRKWSIAWFAWKSEKWIFPKLNIFSLPSMDRQTFFPMDKLAGMFFFLPNFPSIKVINRYAHYHKSFSGTLRIVYQGSIGPLHGLEEIISLLKEKVNNRDLNLILRGFISDAYRKELISLSDTLGVSEKLNILPPGSYSSVIEDGITYHIGIGIHRKEDLMNRTLGTSSNKIYEYAASGLPVLLYDNEQFRTHLGSFSWAFFTDCSGKSLLEKFSEIELNLVSLSAQARQDFEQHLNFEYYLNPVCIYLNK